MASILIVDDDTGIRTHLAAGVRELGHEVEVTADATEALAVMDRSAFDVVLSDIRMAGMDGLALLRELRRRHPEAGVVLMTAYATIPDAVADDDTVRVVVSDSGPGIPRDQRERIFERFVQGREGPGGAAGLGLAIVRDIVETHGGRVHLESEVGWGSRFTIDLPRG